MPGPFIHANPGAVLAAPPSSVWKTLPALSVRKPWSRKCSGSDVSEARPPKVPALPAMEPAAGTELALDFGPWSTHCFFAAVYVQRAHDAFALPGLPGFAGFAGSSGAFSAEQSVQHWPEPPQPA